MEVCTLARVLGPVRQRAALAGQARQGRLRRAPARQLLRAVAVPGATASGRAPTQARLMALSCSTDALIPTSSFEVVRPCYHALLLAGASTAGGATSDLRMRAGSLAGCSSSAGGWGWASGWDSGSLARRQSSMSTAGGPSSRAASLLGAPGCRGWSFTGGPDTRGASFTGAPDSRGASFTGAPDSRAASFTDAHQPCGELCDSPRVPHARRAWCAPATGSGPVGRDRLPPKSGLQHSLSLACPVLTSLSRALLTCGAHHVPEGWRLHAGLQ